MQADMVASEIGEVDSRLCIVRHGGARADDSPDSDSPDRRKDRSYQDAQASFVG